jgi:hypothetical protein
LTPSEQEDDAAKPHVKKAADGRTFRFVDQLINGCHAWNVLNETSAFPGFLVLQTMEDCDTDTEEKLEEHQSENDDA